MEILPNKQQEYEKSAADEHLYETFKKIGSLQAYEYLNGNLEYRGEQKRQFIAGKIQNPNLDYPEIDSDELNQIEFELVSMKKNVISEEENELLKQVYRWRLNEKIAEVRMLKAVADRDMHRFLRYFEFVYDKPSSDVFSYTVCSIRSHVEKFQESKDQIINQTANNLLKALPIMEQPVFSELPNQETVQYAHTQTIKELGDLINIPFEDSKINAIQIQEAFKSALTYIDANEWKTLIDEESSQSSISTNQELQTIKIPESRSVTKNKLANLIVHEIGTHVARRINGERSSLKLLGLGLDRYEVGEEGIATMREQALNNKVDDFRGIEGQLAVGLGLGVDGQPRDFREVYEIMEKYYLFKNLVAKKEFSDAQTKAQNSAWNRTVRTFRGTDCNTPGVCLTKDIIYSDGNIGIWNVIKKIQMRCSVLT